MKVKKNEVWKRNAPIIIENLYLFFTLLNSPAYMCHLVWNSPTMVDCFTGLRCSQVLHPFHRMSSLQAFKPIQSPLHKLSKQLNSQKSGYVPPRDGLKSSPGFNDFKGLSCSINVLVRKPPHRTHRSPGRDAAPCAARKNPAADGSSGDSLCSRKVMVVIAGTFYRLIF